MIQNSHQQRYRGKGNKHHGEDAANSDLREIRQNAHKQIRQKGKIVLHNIPNETTEDEVKEMLQGWVYDIPVVNVYIHTPRSPSKKDILTLLAFVQLDGNDSADRIVNYYNQHRNKLGTRGYLYTNEKDITSEISVEYCYVRSHKQKDVKLEHYDASDVEEEIRNIKKEREQFLASIVSLEDELKKRLPDLFVSEFQMNELRKEEYELNEKIKVQRNQLELGNLCLKDVKEDIQLLNKLSDEGDEDDERTDPKDLITREP